MVDHDQLPSARRGLPLTDLRIQSRLASTNLSVAPPLHFALLIQVDRSMELQSPYASETPSLTLTEHRALIFDVYGTLIDWESPIHDALGHVFPDLPREEILVRYAEVEGKLQMQLQSTPYSKILELAYRQLVVGVEGKSGKDSEQRRVSASDGAALRFGRSIADWKPFPDTIDALHRLKQHFALVVLSNVDDHSFAQTHAKLCTLAYPGSAYPTIAPDSPFALVLTAQQVGAYKPDPFMLASALRQLSANPDPSLPSNPGVHVDASGVLVVANSLRHDILPAIQHGLSSVWISRYGVNVIGNERNLAIHFSDREGATRVDDQGGKYPYTWRYETLGRMADAVEGEVQE